MASQITTHVLDISTGRPASHVPVTLARFVTDRWVELGRATTDDDGRVSNLSQDDLPSGTYKLSFDTSSYFAGQEHFHPVVEITFEYRSDGDHCHVPLLVSPFGYTTYRGS